jgi:hypothetical protein
MHFWQIQTLVPVMQIWQVQRRFFIAPSNDSIHANARTGSDIAHSVCEKLPLRIQAGAPAPLAH